MSCEICEVLPNIEQELLLYDGKFWNANLRDKDQTLLGISFITAKRHVSGLEYLTGEEFTEFGIVCGALAKAVKKSFGAYNVNVSCLMNNAFIHDPENIPEEAAHVHWHLKPRYRPSRIIHIGDDIFRDPLPAQYLEPSRFDRNLPSSETAANIAMLLRDNLDL